MKLLTIDPRTALTIGWVRTLVADWAASPARVTAPDRAAIDLAFRAAEFFRNDFPRLAAHVDAVEAEPPAVQDPFFAAVFTPEDVRGAVDRVAMWSEVFDISVTGAAADCLAYQLGQHFAGVLLDTLACASLPDTAPEAALKSLLRRLVPADQIDNSQGGRI